MQATVIDPADVEALESALNKKKVCRKGVFLKASMYCLVKDLGI